MDFLEPLDGLHLDDNALLDKEIEPVTTIQALPGVDEGQRFLAFDAQTAPQELECQTGVITRLQHPRAEFLVHIQRRSDDGLGYCIQPLFHASTGLQKAAHRPAS